MFFGFDTKRFQDELKGASLDDIKYQVNWCEEFLKGIRDGLINPNKDIENYLSTLIHHCEQELKSRKQNETKK
jgi:hypothetical protein